MSLESSPLLDPDGLVGRVLAERYLIEERLGEGGMGTVYRAAHVKVGRSFAIKVLHPELLRNEKVVWRFEREAESAARMRHPNVVPALDVGTTEEGLRYLVMDFVDGPDLAEIMLEAPMPPPRVVWLVRQILEGLQHAHHHGLVHRDLKPQNIIVETDADGREIPRIVDFGISILASDEEDESSRLTTSGMVLGTPLYMAPEQAVAGEIDHRVDLFALGLIVYEMLSGALPFDGTGAQVARANLMLDPPAMSKRVPDLSVDPLLEAFTRRLMARDRDRRPGTAREARELLDLIERDRKAAAAVLSVASDAAPSQILTVPRLPSVSDAPSGKVASRPQVDPKAVTEISDKIPAGSAPLVMVQEEGSEVVVSLAPLESGPAERPATRPPPGQVDLSHVGARRPVTGPPSPYPLPYFPGDPPPMVAQPFQGGAPVLDRRAERYLTTEHGYRHNAGRRRRWLVAGALGSAVLGIGIIGIVVRSGPQHKEPDAAEVPVEVKPGVAPADSPTPDLPGQPSDLSSDGEGNGSGEGSGSAEGSGEGQGSAVASASPEEPPAPPEIKQAAGNNKSGGGTGKRLTGAPVAPVEPVRAPVAPEQAQRAAAPPGKGEPEGDARAKPSKPEAAKPASSSPASASASSSSGASSGPPSLTKRYRDVGGLIARLPADAQEPLWIRYRRINKDAAAADVTMTAAAMKQLDDIERDVNALLKK